MNLKDLVKEKEKQELECNIELAQNILFGNSRNKIYIDDKQRNELIDYVIEAELRYRKITGRFYITEK